MAFVAFAHFSPDFALAQAAPSTPPLLCRNAERRFERISWRSAYSSAAAHLLARRTFSRGRPQRISKRKRFERRARCATSTFVTRLSAVAGRAHSGSSPAARSIPLRGSNKSTLDEIVARIVGPI
jgi:hypothetical protein